MPIRLLLLRRTDLFRNELFKQLMNHEEERQNYPDYWDKVANIFAPFILDVLNNEDHLDKSDKSDKLDIEDVVRSN